MIIGIGTDLIDCGRLQRANERIGQRFLDRVFTKTEQQRCNLRMQRFQSYGKVFAAKEAVLKALGDVSGIQWQEIEITHLPNGKPIVTLFGAALNNFKKLLMVNQDGKIDLSITDEPPYAQAFVVISASPALETLKG
jgi:holo-[acyl-carrier protein] synthase